MKQRLYEHCIRWNFAQSKTINSSIVSFKEGEICYEGSSKEKNWDNRKSTTASDGPAAEHAKKQTLGHKTTI